MLEHKALSEEMSRDKLLQKRASIGMHVFVKALDIHVKPMLKKDIEKFFDVIMKIPSLTIPDTLFTSENPIPVGSIDVRVGDIAYGTNNNSSVGIGRIGKGSGGKGIRDFAGLR